MTNYAKGRAFEYRVRDLLQDHGWTVFRMAGSKTKADLIGFRRTLGAAPNIITYFIQCKAKGAFGTKEREEFLEIVHRCDVVGLFACAPRRKIEFYFAGDRKSADHPFYLPDTRAHATNCDYHADQNSFECTCGLTRKAA